MYVCTYIYIYIYINNMEHAACHLGGRARPEAAPARLSKDM